MSAEPPPPPQVSQAPKKKLGCWFYGCLTLFILAVVGAFVLFFGARHLIKSIANKYTDPAPIALPQVEFTESEQAALDGKIQSFKETIDTGKAAQPLILTDEEINALIARDPELSGKVYVTIEGDEITGQVSIPLEALPLPGVKGRYLNGSATIKASLKNDRLFVTAESIKVQGKPLPEEFMSSFRQENLAKNAMNDPEIAEVMAKLERIEIEDGKVIFTPKSSTEAQNP